jgi:hypothetical protein
MSKPDAFAASAAALEQNLEAEEDTIGEEEEEEDMEVEVEVEMEEAGDNDGDDDEEEEGAILEQEEETLHQTPLEAWRQVHAQLLRAVTMAREAVAAKKAQRRFWMEEICANLTEEGSLTSSSVWKRPVPSRKASQLAKNNKVATNKSAAAPTKKRKKKFVPTTPDSLASGGNAPKKARKSFLVGSKGRSPPSTGKKKSKLRLKLPTNNNKQQTAAEEAAAEATADIVETSDEEEDDDDEDVVAEVEAEEVDEDEEDEDDDRGETDDEEDEDEGDAGDDHYGQTPQQHYPPQEYQQHGQWGGRPPHPYMVSYKAIKIFSKSSSQFFVAHNPPIVFHILSSMRPATAPQRILPITISSTHSSHRILTNTRGFIRGRNRV